MSYAAATGVALTAPHTTLAEMLRQIPKRKLPGSTESLAVVGYGSANAFAGGDMELSRELIQLFLDHGGSYIDTAGDGKKTVGSIMREKNAQEQLFLGTYVSGNNLSELRAEVKEAIELQGVDALDLVVSRAPLDFSRRRDEYQTLKEEGLVRHLCVARPNKRFYPPMMELMRDAAVDFVQVNYSMMEPGAADEILPLAQETETAVVINRPFINGDYFGLVSGHELPAWAADFDCESWAQFSLKFILAHPAVNVVLTETSNPRHAIDNMGASFGKLPDADQRKRMEDVIRRLR